MWRVVEHLGEGQFLDSSTLCKLNVLFVNSFLHRFWHISEVDGNSLRVHDAIRSVVSYWLFSGIVGGSVA